MADPTVEIVDHVWVPDARTGTDRDAVGDWTENDGVLLTQAVAPWTDGRRSST